MDMCTYRPPLIRALSGGKLVDCPLCKTHTDDEIKEEGRTELAHTSLTNGRKRSVADLTSQGYPHIVCFSRASAKKTTVEQVLPAFQPRQVSRKCHSLPRNYKPRLHECKQSSGESQCQQEKISQAIGPADFKTRLDLMKEWFSDFTDEQKNTVIKALLLQCGRPQNHLLSVLLQPILHEHCPTNCQDWVSTLPPGPRLRIFSHLDPTSLGRCAAVCRAWCDLVCDPYLWQRLCARPQWRLSPAAEKKQLQMARQCDGCVDWKDVFRQRYRLRRNWLRGSCHVRTFHGHTQAVFCVQFDETRIVSGSSDKTIKVWNMRTNSPWSVMTLVGHSGTVRCLHLNGNRLVSGSSDCTIKVWDLSTEQSWSSIACKVTMVGHGNTVRCLQSDNHKVVSGSYDHTLKVWDMKTGQCLQTLVGHEGAVLCLQFDTDRLVSGSCDRSIRVWHLASGQHLATLQGHQDAVTCLQFDTTKIVSGSLDRTIKLWSLESGHCLRTLDWMKSEGHTGVIRCLRADRWRIVSGGDDRTLKVWSLDTGQRLVTLQNHTDGVTCLHFNDSVIVSGSYDQTVKLWDFTVC
ncbi:F-box/WD repeat-containing protein 7-like isoform X1 [Ornithodoros turicata]|uniref:F-box/WD repeat-containing protein 7-like isoform X1 n=1 Tax=Ornithodoros turicata TaxID=34597 RepID=UPI003139AD59